MYSIDPVWQQTLEHPCGSQVLVYHTASGTTHLLSGPAAWLLRELRSGATDRGELTRRLEAESQFSWDEEGGREQFLDSALGQLLGLDLLCYDETTTA